MHIMMWTLSSGLDILRSMLKRDFLSTHLLDSPLTCLITFKLLKPLKIFNELVLFKAPKKF